MNDFYALIAIEFDPAVDAISREMFSERMAEYGWRKLPAGWQLEFEARSRSSCHDTVKTHLQLASQAARIERDHVRAGVMFSDSEPTVV